jgi:hypothetical protein
MVGLSWGGADGDAMEIPSDVPYDVPTIAVIVVIGIAIALVMCWGAHLFERWWWSRRA